MTMRRAGTIFLVIPFFLSFAWAAEKEKSLPKDLPPYGPMKPFTVPKVAPRKLANGLTLWLVPRPEFPKVSLVAAVRGGKASDPKDRPGLSVLLADTLDQGTKTRSARQIAEELQAAGGDFSRDPEADDLILSASVLSSKVEAALTILADILQNATFPDSEVALAKRNAADRLRSQEANPSFLMSRALARAVFGDHPYSIIAPTQDSIARTTAEELRGEFLRRFRPDQVALMVVGDFEVEKLMVGVESLLGKWQAPPEPPLPAAKKPSQTGPHAVFYVARPESVQTTIALGTLAPTRGEAEYPAAQVANAIYGGMFGSRLILNIREDKGYTYSPGAFLNPHQQVSVFQSWADVRNEVTGATLNEMNYELNRMGTTAPKEDELVHAQRYLTGTRVIRLQSQDAVASEFARLWIFDLSAQELGTEIERIQRVTAKEVEAVGAKYFPAARQTIVAVGEVKVIQDQLSPFGVEIRPAP